MSLGKRAYNILRGYVNREWDRIQALDRLYAEKELAESTQAPAPPPEAELPTPNEAAPTDPKARARELLGVGPDASFEEIRKAFERLNKRSDPRNFPAGSPEAAQAASIRQRVNWAYQTLTEHVDVTEKRFKSLEIE